MVGGYQIVDFSYFDLADINDTTIKGVYSKVSSMLPTQGNQHKPYCVKLKYAGNVIATQNFHLWLLENSIALTLLSLNGNIDDQTITGFSDAIGFRVNSDDTVTQILL